MKYLVALICCFALISSTPPWESDFEKAKQIARERHTLILLNFSGSDWCGPCIRMKKEIFENNNFSQMAETTLVLVNADFPRRKKNQLSTNIVKQNEQLADKYNPLGKFPFTLLLNAEGGIIHSWDGFPESGTDDFVRDVKALCDANKQ